MRRRFSTRPRLATFRKARISEAVGCPNLCPEDKIVDRASPGRPQPCTSDTITALPRPSVIRHGLVRPLAQSWYDTFDSPDIRARSCLTHVQSHVGFRRAKRLCRWEGDVSKQQQASDCRRRPCGFLGRSLAAHRTRANLGCRPAKRSAGGGSMNGLSINVMVLGAHGLAPRSDGGSLVDPSSSRMLVSKIKPCMSQCKPH
jgi:hypothetical protein